MKKIIYSVLIAALTTGAAYAQDEEVAVAETESTDSGDEKKGCCAGGDRLPAAGDIGLSVDASSFLQYAGNMFNGENFNSAPTFDLENQTIMVKYFIADDMAVRVRFANTQTKLKLQKFGQGMKWMQMRELRIERCILMDISSLELV